MKSIIHQRFEEIFSKTFLTSLLSIFCILTSSITFGATLFSSGVLISESKRPIEIKINSIKQLQNIEIDERMGMKIYTDYNIHYADNKKCQVMVQFFNDQGDNLKDSNGLYSDKDANVIVAKEFYPKNQFQTGYCMDFFIPYDELHLEPGKHEIYFKVLIVYDDQVISESSRTNFHISLKFMREIAVAIGH